MSTTVKTGCLGMKLGMNDHTGTYRQHTKYEGILTKPH